MRHVFTTREKVLLVILAVLVIAVGYWKLILTPITTPSPTSTPRPPRSRMPS